MCVVGVAESARLNARYRGRDRPTNVLSFAPPPPRSAAVRAAPLGELVICPRILRQEARAQVRLEIRDRARRIGGGRIHLLGGRGKAPRVDHADEYPHVL